MPKLPALPLLGIAALVAASALADSTPLSRDPARLPLLQPNYPRAFFFRASEAAARKPGVDYAAWDAEFSRLMGIMGKCLDEEVLRTEAQNPGIFSRFKQQHPEQAVLLHFNGNSRDPRYHTEPYFPGHWIYRKAVRILSDIPAAPGETAIQVEDASDFQVAGGRYKTSADDIALFGVTADGKHDWHRCEQVQLTAVDLKTNTIRVRRGCYGSQPLAFQAGKSRAAAHQCEGPWGKTSNLLWYYNFATHCPRDARGRTCADLLVDDLAQWFGPSGKLAAFDGLEFDVMFHETHGDTDGDGEVDDGIINGLNHYGIGMIGFARKLRERMGDRFIIQGDGALGPGGIRSQRASGWLNGIESEGFPNLNDWAMEDWSGGLNRHAFWAANGRPPAFSYINHKWTQPVPGKPGEQQNPDVPLARHRLAFAGAVFTDAAICYSYVPKRGNDRLLGIWDELIGGTLQKPGWLGKPLGAPVHLATATPDLLRRPGDPLASLAQRIGGDVAVQTPGPDGLRISALTAAAPEFSFSVRGIPTSGEDLVVQLTLAAAPRQGYPQEMARLVHLTASGDFLSLLAPTPQQTGMTLRGQPESALSKDSGASLAYRPAQPIGDQILPAYLFHPPYRSGRGSVFWCRDLTLPAEPELRFSLGMGEKSPQRSDGVWFQVWVAELQGKQPGPFRQVFEKSTNAHAWIPCSVPLADWAGKPVRLKFVADCGPQDNATTDHGMWGNVRIVRSGTPDTAVTPPKTLMTWANDRPFGSVFHFRGIHSKTCDLEFRIEGSEPVTIHSLTVHGHPGAAYRRFENGIVLANPGLKAYSFDLNVIAPGCHFRRLQGSRNQDPETNNGSPVNGAAVLDERDALFLARIP